MGSVEITDRPLFRVDTGRRGSPRLSLRNDGAKLLQY